MNTVYAAADEKNATVSAAFDTINHDVFIGRLEQLQLGVDGGASSWLRSYTSQTGSSS